MNRLDIAGGVQFLALLFGRPSLRCAAVFILLHGTLATARTTTTTTTIGRDSSLSLFERCGESEREGEKPLQLVVDAAMANLYALFCVGGGGDYDDDDGRASGSGSGGSAIQCSVARRPEYSLRARKPVRHLSQPHICYNSQL